MKRHKQFSVSVAVAAVLSISVVAEPRTGAAYDTVYRGTGFSSENYTNDWTATSGTWTRIYQYDKTHHVDLWWIKATGSHAKLDAAVPTSPGHLLETVELRAKIKLTSSNAYASLYLIDGSGQNYLKFSVGKQGDGYLEAVQIYGRRSDATTISESVPSPIPSGDAEWHTLRCLVTKDHMYSLWLDDALMVSVSAFDNPVPLENLSTFRAYSRSGTHEFDSLGVTASYSTVDVFDDFEDGDLDTDLEWTEGAGTWTVENIGQDAYVTASGSHASLYTSLDYGNNGRRFERIEVEGDVQLVSSYAYASFYLFGDASNYLKFSVGKQGDSYLPYLDIYGRRNGASTFSQSVSSPLINSDTSWHHVKCVWNSDNSYELWLDGVKHVSGQDTSSPVTLGYFKKLRLYSRAGTRRFDNIRIRMIHDRDLVREDFEDGEYTSDPAWSKEAGTWAAEEGESAFGLPIYWMKATGSHARLRTPVDLITQSFEELHIGFKLKQSGNGYGSVFLTDSARQNYLKFSVGKQGSGYNERLNIQTRYNGATKFDISTPSPIASGDTGWHDVEIVIKHPNHYEIWLDGDNLLEGAAESRVVALNTLTHVDLYSRGGSRYFDDVTVSGLPLVPAFPGAEGYGALALGGRGGDVYYVTNTLDYDSSDSSIPPIEGSLRYGIATADGPRTILFAVGGTIELARSMSMGKPYITYAGQTAPGGGICLKKYQTGLGGSAGHDIILQYMRFRLGQDPDVYYGNAGYTFNVSGKRNIIDHASFSWSTDQVFNIRGVVDQVTAQWNIISEALQYSKHPDARDPNGVGHSFATIFSVNSDSRMSVHHNLFIHNWGRNPFVTANGPFLVEIDWVNNLVYNWGNQLGRSRMTPDFSEARWNAVNNLYIHGPSTDPNNDPTLIYSNGGETSYIYFAGNKRWNGATAYTLDKLTGDYSVSTYPYASGLQTADTINTIYNDLVSDAGATLPARDEVDLRVVEDVENRTGKFVSDYHFVDEPDVYYWPDLDGEVFPETFDADLDGMPDDWETANGLDPYDPDDGTAFNDDDGFAQYTNLELYLHSLY